jgi:hypothetical protein
MRIGNFQYNFFLSNFQHYSKPKKSNIFGYFTQFEFRVRPYNLFQISSYFTQYCKVTKNVLYFKKLYWKFPNFKHVTKLLRN